MKKLTKNNAIELRRQGKSYSEISKILSVPKSTLSYWLKSIQLKPEQKKRLYTKQIINLNKGSKSLKARREKEVRELILKAESEISKSLDLETFKLMGAALYWAEGSKGKRAQITNSDPLLIAFMVKWIDKCFGIKSKNLKARLNIYSKQNEQEIIKYWSDLLKIPKKNFGKSYIKPSGTGYRKNILYYGTIRVEIPRSTDICYIINGWIMGAARDISPQVTAKSKKWKHLIRSNKPVNL